MESYVRIGGRDLENLTYPYMGVWGVKNYQNHPYVINERPLRTVKVLGNSVPGCPQFISVGEKD